MNKYELAEEKARRIINKHNKGIEDCQFGYDEEKAHLDLDDLLCDILLAEGYDKVVELFCEQDKWYA